MHTFFPYTLRTQLQLLKNLARNYKFWIILGTDTLLIIAAIIGAYAIRFECSFPPMYAQQCVSLIPLILGIKIPSFYFFGLYRGMWRFTTLSDVINILTVSLFSSSLLLSVILIGNRFAGFSRSVFILDCLLTCGFISGHRIAIRYFYQQFGTRNGMLPPLAPHEKKRLLLIGSDATAEKVLREMLDNNQSPYIPVGLVDDDPHKIGMKLHNVPVLGLIDTLKQHVLRTNAQEILITTMAGNRRQMRSIVAQCQQTQLPFKVLPSMSELISGKVSVKTIRDISYKDLLGREEVRLDVAEIGAYLRGKTLLITGAGGSIGSELCRQSLRFEPQLLILFDSSEENLYRVQMELRHEHESINTLAILGKIQDISLLNNVFDKHQPDVIFHTAAYKHVPLVERNPWQAVSNNIVGTQLLMEAAILHRVERFVLVSTDKAVRPTNVMGASKRVTELLMLAYSQHCWDGTLSEHWTTSNTASELRVQHSYQQHHTRFMGVRFGNVLGSSGSVIPLFRRQIERGGPVTVTDPEVTRYFMSAEEAAQLILQSGAMGQGGEIFILKMGDPIKIDQMARELIRLSGREPDLDIEVRYIGLRAGEKLYEELITAGEGIIDTHHEKIMVLCNETIIPCRVLNSQLELLATKTRHLDSRGIKETLKTMVPEYSPDFSI